MDAKQEAYAALFPQLKAVVEGERDEVARRAHIVAMLRETFHFWWTGFYRVETPETLVVGPYQGPLACTRIQLGKGVCGTAWRENRTVVVPDVSQFPGHIACSSQSRSEIVVPVRDSCGNVVAVLDIDSERLHNFDETDALWIQKITTLA